VGEAEKAWEIKSSNEIAFYLNGLALQKYHAIKNDYLPTKTKRNYLFLNSSCIE
jgi:hypothetical protein